MRWHQIWLQSKFGPRSAQINNPALLFLNDISTEEVYSFINFLFSLAASFWCNKCECCSERNIDYPIANHPPMALPLWHRPKR